MTIWYNFPTDNVESGVKVLWDDKHLMEVITIIREVGKNTLEIFVKHDFDILNEVVMVEHEILPPNTLNEVEGENAIVYNGNNQVNYGNEAIDEGSTQGNYGKEVGNEGNE